MINSAENDIIDIICNFSTIFIEGKVIMLQFYLSILETEEERSEFEYLYLTYRSKMYNIALKYLKNPADAEDAVQEAFLRIADKSAKIFQVSQDKKQGYLFSLVRNIAIDMFNKKISHKEVEYDDKLDSEPDTAIPLEDKILGKIAHSELLDYICSMPAGMKDAIYMKYVHEYSNSEIAEMLGITENALRQRLFAARKLIKEFVEANDPSNKK